MKLALVASHDPILRRVQPPLGRAPTEEDRERIAAMFDLMQREDGLGLAAPQVGWEARVFVVAAGVFDADGIGWAFVDPGVWAKGPEISDWEGCLSFPGERKLVPRARSALVQGRFLHRDERGMGGLVTGEFTFTGLAARVVQHENDHLDGRCIA